MKDGKTICKELKAIRMQIANANGIKYAPVECHHKGECKGTCPACEAELKHLENEISARRKSGMAASVVGVAMAGMMAMAPVNADAQNTLKKDNPTEKEIDLDSVEVIGYGLTKKTIDIGGEIRTYKSIFEDNLKEYVEKNLHYPSKALEQNLEGYADVCFEMKKNGKIKHVKVVGFSNKLFKKEAKRAFKKLPRQKPLEEHGIPVETSHKIRINFKLPKDKIAN